MRQQEKQAAAARELLKAEAARKRKAAAATLRKGSAPVAVRTASAAAQMRKGAGGAAPAQMRKGAGGAATSPEVRAAGAGDFNNSGTSPTSFVDGSCFFNNSGSLFGGGGPSSMSQPWVPSQSSDPTTWDTNPTPHGGFTNLIHPHLSQNYHFTGGLSHFAPFKAPRSMESEEEMSTPPAAMEENEYVDVDSEDELPRTEKRILWSQEEDVRLMSSWLHNSTDPTIGADRKNEQYWNDVANTYNETTPSQRKRNAKQAKDRFHKINKWTDLFHSAWVKARSIYTSGHNDQMWIDKAHYFYIEDNKEQKLGRFVLLDVWYAVRNEAKWITYNKGLKEARKRKGSDKDKEGEDAVDIDLEEVGEQPRPMGQKRAKKLALEKNSKKNESDIEELDKFGKIQSEEHANRLKVLEVQQKLSSEKIEQAKLAHQAAKEQKAAAEVQREARKLEVEARMFETYNRLLSVDVSLMSDEEKVDHANTVKYLKKKLFADI